MKYQQQNKSTIAGAFARLQKAEEDAIAKGMCRLAKAGLEYLVEAHDSFGYVLRHTEETNTLAYAVAKDGVIVVSDYLDGGSGDLPGNAREKAATILSGTKGWAAVIVSDMEGWYRVDWEMHFLHISVAQIKENFHSFFKKVN